MDNPIKVLIADKDENNFIKIHDLLSEIQMTKFIVEWITNIDFVLEKIKLNKYDVYLIDNNLWNHQEMEGGFENKCPVPIIWLINKEDQTNIKSIEDDSMDYLIKEEINSLLLELSIRYLIERTKILRKLRESEERYNLVTRSVSDGLWYWNLETDEIEFSSQWKSMLGYEDSDIRNSTEEWFNRVHPEDIKNVQRDISIHIDGFTPQFQNEHRLLHKDGNYRWMISRGRAERNSSGKALRLIGSHTDITRHKITEQQMRQNAFFDSLTGLPNRKIFSNRLERTIERCKRYSGEYLFAVLFLDLDDFKIINDSLGHIAGDRLLVEVAQRLKICLRSVDTVARFGGDEFAIILDDIKEVNDAMRVANRIQNKIMEPFKIANHEIFTTASIGIAVNANRYDNPEELLRDADTAMYNAKKKGKACYQMFDKQMHIQAVSRLQLENDLRRAIKNEELRVYYQPIISLKTGKIIGFEALVRWQHPEQGLIFPGQFLPVAKRTGLILSIDQWVLKEACRKMSIWVKKFPSDPPMFISVNFSRKHFDQLNLVDKICQSLKETGLANQILRPEITESEIIENFESAKYMLSELKELNILLHMDDFGTGYSSLSYLVRFHVDTLKIDASFVRNMYIGSENFEIVKMIITLAHNLGMSVIAEGVETIEQKTQLQKLECEYAQGYFFSKPLDSKNTEDLLESNPKW